MAELPSFSGTMNCGKSTLALQIHHNAVAAGKHCLLFTRRIADRRPERSSTSG